MPNQSTKQLIEIKDIRDNVVVLKNGSMRMVLDVSSINFELRSEEEQGAILQNFQQFLNSIDFPLQIIINSRKFDIAEYLRFTQETTANLTNELLKIQAAEYMKYIKELSELANIMSKKFYIVISFYVSEVKSGSSGGLLNIFQKSKSPSSASGFSDEQFANYQVQLKQRADLVFDGLVGLGLKTRVLDQNELINLFSSLYNPGTQTNQQPTN
jgi:hypothetical protein